MSKSVLSIVVSSPVNGLTVLLSTRTIEVPCRLPEAFNFKFAGLTWTAILKSSNPGGSGIDQVEPNGIYPDDDQLDRATATAEAILNDAKGMLMLGPARLHSSPLQSIALAYEAEVAAYDAAVKAHRELPRSISGDVMYWVDPREGTSMACRMLAKYVEHVFEQAAKAHEVKS